MYLIYGMYEMLNVVAGGVGEAQADLIRAAKPLNGWKADLSGPGRLTRAFQLTRSEYGLDLTGDRLLLPGRSSVSGAGGFRETGRYRLRQRMEGCWAQQGGATASAPCSRR